MTDEFTVLDRARDGDLDAFKELVDRYKSLVYGVVYDMTNNTHDAEDVMQEVFVKMYKGLAGFRRASKVSTWVYRIAVNACYDHLSKRTTHAMKPSDELERHGNTQPMFHATAGVDPEREASSRVLQDHIEHAIGRLTPRERSVFVLRHYNDLPLREIAAVLKISEGTVKSMLSRALKRLQKELSFYRHEMSMEDAS